MRQVVFGGANSLDNYLARANDAVDWLAWNDEVAEFMATYWPRFDAVIMGRKTYDIAAAAGQGNGYPGVANYVFSRTLTAPPSGGVTLVRDHAERFVQNLKEMPGSGRLDTRPRHTDSRTDVFYLLGPIASPNWNDTRVTTGARVAEGEPTNVSRGGAMPGKKASRKGGQKSHKKSR